MMSRGQVRLLNGSVALVTITGVAFAVMKYWMKSDDPFAVINHPWQPHALHLHVLLAPIAVFAFGWTFGNHMWPAFANGAPKRASGIGAMILIVPMVLSGYGLQVVTSDAARKAFAVTHWISSGLFVFVWAVHIAFRKKAAEAARAQG